jgi:hypothetical protein
MIKAVSGQITARRIGSYQRNGDFRGEPDSIVVFRKKETAPDGTPPFSCTAPYPLIILGIII